MIENSFTRFQVFMLILLCSILLFIFNNTFILIFEICFEDDDYSHGLLLPLISGYLLYEQLDQIKNSPKINNNILTSLAGAIIFCFGMLCYLFSCASNLLYPAWLAFFICLAGILLLLFDWKLNKIIAPPLLLLFMAQPIPRSLIPRLFNPLQELAAFLSAKVLEILSVPVYLKGNIIEIPNLTLLVEEACSGIRSLMAISTVTFIVLILFNMSNIKKILFFIISVFLAVLLNIIRVVATGVIAHFYSKDIASGFLHSFSGLVVFFLALLILYWLGSIFTRSKREQY